MWRAKGTYFPKKPGASLEHFIPWIVEITADSTVAVPLHLLTVETPSVTPAGNGTPYPSPECARKRIPTWSLSRSSSICSIPQSHVRFGFDDERDPQTYPQLVIYRLRRLHRFGNNSRVFSPGGECARSLRIDSLAHFL